MPAGGEGMIHRDILRRVLSNIVYQAIDSWGSDTDDTIGMAVEDIFHAFETYEVDREGNQIGRKGESPTGPGDSDRLAASMSR